MEKIQCAKDDFFEWWNNNGRRHWKRRNEPRREKKQEEMIRSLRSIFCKGRYRSWTARQK
jgi:hypothetical protein